VGGAASGSEVLVALDTSNRIGSVAVAIDGRVLAEESLGVEGRQAAQLIPVLDRVLAAFSLSPRDLSGVIVGSGPGSFTGVRIGVATARGLAHALDIPVWPRCSLEGAYQRAVGQLVPEDSQDSTLTSDSVGASPPNPNVPPLLVLFDARADRVYAAGWQSDAPAPVPFLAPSALTLGELPGLGLPAGTHACGSGASRHREALEAWGITVLPEPLGEPSASGLLRAHWAETAANGGAAALPLAPGTLWAPDYLRPSQPERLAAAEGATGSGSR
jgi:tRNA threonylcarbamoyl adenosine modification protein YeaZ